MKLIVALVFALTMAGSAFAQEGGGANTGGADKGVPDSATAGSGHSVNGSEDTQGANRAHE